MCFLFVVVVVLIVVVCLSFFGEGGVAPVVDFCRSVSFFLLFFRGGGGGVVCLFVFCQCATSKTSAT